MLYRINIWIAGFGNGMTRGSFVCMGVRLLTKEEEGFRFVNY